MLKIKAFGQDRQFLTVKALQSALSHEYKGRHVSIIYATKPSGLLKTIFISVGEDGAVNQTYGEEAQPIDFAAIERELL
jgi:hypothetical protein